MSETSDQAGADQDPDTQTVIDPLDAMMNAPQNGADGLSSYEEDLAALQRGEVPAGYHQAEAGEEPEEFEQEEEQEFDENEAEDEDPAAADDADEVEEQEEAPRKDVLRARFRRQDDIAIAELARALDIPLLDAAKQFEAAKAGLKGTEQEQEAQAPARTHAQAKAELDAKKAEMAEAIEAVDFDTQKRLFLEIEALRDELPDLKDSERNATATARAREDEIKASVYDASEEKAFQFYPGLKDPESPIYKRMAEIYGEMVKLGDPLADDPDRPWIIAKEAAKDTKTLMTKPKAQATATPAAKKKVSPFQPASGNGRTTSADATSAAKEIDGVDSLEAYERLVGRR